MDYTKYTMNFTFKKCGYLISCSPLQLTLYSLGQHAFRRRDNKLIIAVTPEVKVKDGLDMEGFLPTYIS